MTIYIPEDLLREIKIYCVNQNIALTQYIESLVRKDSSNRKSEELKNEDY